MDKEDIPPKTVKAQLVRLDDNLKQIERKQFAGIQRAPGSLPVLEAFQLFLENERKTSQRRLLVVTTSAIAAILLTVAGAGLYIWHTLQRADERTDAIAFTTAELQQSLGSISDRQQTTDERLAQAARHLIAQRRALSEQTERLSQQQQVASSEQAGRDAELMQLREQLLALQAAQDSMQQLLATMGSDRMSRTTTTSLPTNRRSETMRTNRRSSPQPETSPQYEIVTLTPEGRAGIRWMLPTENARE